MVEAPIVMQEPPMPVDLGMSLDVPASRKPLAMVALLWAAARPGGVSRADASRIVAPELDPDGPSGLRKLRRFLYNK